MLGSQPARLGRDWEPGELQLTDNQGVVKLVVPNPGNLGPGRGQKGQAGTKPGHDTPSAHEKSRPGRVGFVVTVGKPYFTRWP